MDKISPVYYQPALLQNTLDTFSSFSIKSESNRIKSKNGAVFELSSTFLQCFAMKDIVTLLFEVDCHAIISCRTCFNVVRRQQRSMLWYWCLPYLNVCLWLYCQSCIWRRGFICAVPFSRRMEVKTTGWSPVVFFLFRGVPTVSLFHSFVFFLWTLFKWGQN